MSTIFDLPTASRPISPRIAEATRILQRAGLESPADIRLAVACTLNTIRSLSAVPAPQRPDLAIELFTCLDGFDTDQPTLDTGDRT